jgi:hypothetical protein
MKTNILLATVLAVAICGLSFAQSLEQKYQQADVELNRVYKELRVNLNEPEKAELKKIQLAWLKDKERAIQSVDSTNEKLRIATDLTIQRTNELRSNFSDSEVSKLLVGKWVFYQGSKYSTTYIFKSDNSFTKETDAPRYGTFIECTGSWRIKNEQLVLHQKGHRRIEDGQVVLNEKNEQEPRIVEIKFNSHNSLILECEVFDREPQ